MVLETIRNTVTVDYKKRSRLRKLITDKLDTNHLTD